MKLLWHCIAALCTAGAFCGETPPEEVPPAQAKPADNAGALVQRGRALFDENRFTDALTAFESALAKNTNDRDTRFLCGLAAYWARQPRKALDYWNPLEADAQSGSNEEWEITSHRVLALSALQQHGAAELAIERMKALREKGGSKTVRAALGFVREHVHSGSLRGGCWEALDPRGESPTVWSVTVARIVETPGEKKAGSKYVGTLLVERAPLPGGGTGFVLSEDRDGERLIYKRWVLKPEYEEARALWIQVIAGKLEPIEVLKSAAPGTDPGPAPVTAELRALGMDPQTEAILAVLWRLNSVKADMAALSRTHNDDKPAQDAWKRALLGKFPWAQRDADDLARFIVESKASNVLAACAWVLKRPRRGAFMEISLLVALNSRERDIPLELLDEFSKSGDAFVRQTANLMRARLGSAAGLKALLDEAESADARGCEVLMAALTPLLGNEIPMAPNARAADAAEKVVEWKAALAAWRKAREAALKFEALPKDNAPFWHPAAP